MTLSSSKSTLRGRLLIAMILAFSTLMGMSTSLRANADYVYRYDLERKRLEYEVSLGVFAGEHSRDMDIMASGKWKATIESLEDARYRLAITDITKEDEDYPDFYIMMEISDDGRFNVIGPISFIDQGVEEEFNKHIAPGLLNYFLQLTLPPLCISDEIGVPPGHAWTIYQSELGLPGLGEESTFPFQSLMVERIEDGDNGNLVIFTGLSLEETSRTEERLPEEFRISPLNRRLKRGTFEFSLDQSVIIRSELTVQTPFYMPDSPTRDMRAAPPYQEIRYRAELVEIIDLDE